MYFVAIISSGLCWIYDCLNSAEENTSSAAFFFMPVEKMWDDGDLEWQLGIV